jgi:hypothetical protein
MKGKKAQREGAVDTLCDDGLNLAGLKRPILNHSRKYGSEHMRKTMYITQWSMLSVHDGKNYLQ